MNRISRNISHYHAYVTLCIGWLVHYYNILFHDDNYAKYSFMFFVDPFCGLLD